MNFRELVFSANVQALKQALEENPSLAKEDIALPDNPAKAHPLHRICDGVFAGLYSGETAIMMAKLFLQYGASINPAIAVGKDSPLTTACSLHCDELALFYIGHGARIDHQGCHGGTALHWASWCGRDVIVRKLIEMKAAINQRCIDFKSTPLCWALHGYRFGGKDNRHHQVECARILLAHGADPSIPTFEGYLPVQLVEENDTELIDLFRSK
jgi:uncharacterized protein